MELIWFILPGLTVGLLAGQIGRGGPYGLWGEVVLRARAVGKLLTGLTARGPRRYSFLTSTWLLRSRCRSA